MESKLKKKRIGIIGDVIIDKYKYFKAIKLSPEGPAPVVRAISESLSMGGAANVALSIANLNLDVELSFLENFDKNNKFSDLFKLKIKESNLKISDIDSGLFNLIPTKIRYYVDGKQFMREDKEESIINISEKEFLNEEFVEKYANKYSLIIISDYQKGLISNSFMQLLISYCNKMNIPLFIDTKKNNLDSIRGAFCLKINESEFNNLFCDLKLDFQDSDDTISKKINSARKLVCIKNLILTLGSRGSFLANQFGVKISEAEEVDVNDITGAGDAFLAGLVYSFINRNSLEEYDIENHFIEEEDLSFSNKAASAVIALKGTEPIPRNFLNLYKKNYFNHRTIGFTNGCFDLIHSGHIFLLEKAKENCDYLIVGINSDNSIKRLKGNRRPINKEEDRYKILKSIKYVDEVIIFEEDTPLRLIKKISPDLLVKGSDYQKNEIVGSDYVESYGGKILRVDFIDDLSTSKTIDKINKNYNK